VVRGSRTYFVAEPIEGSNLAQLLANRKGPLPLDALAYVLACTVDALLVVREAAGRAGLPSAAVNHAIRAEEICVNIEGGVQFLGLARACESRLAASPLYPIVLEAERGVAPELRILSLAEPIDERASVFALGTLLLDCITQTSSTEKPRDAVAAMVQSDLEAALLRIATQASAPVVAKRTPSLRAFRDALQAAFGGSTRPAGFIQLLAIARSVASANQSALDFCIGAEMRSSLRVGTLRGIGAPARYDDSEEDDELHAISLLPEVKGLAQSAWYEPASDSSS
jgi:hypothetical protein